MSRLLLIMVVVLLLGTAAMAAGKEEVQIVPHAEGHTPEVLNPQGSLGQEFIAAQPFDEMWLPIPTWGSADSSFTVLIRRHGPSGELVVEQTVSNAVDNRTELQFDVLGPGRYYVEINHSTGQIGWWTRGDDYARGTAYADGKPVAGHDRELIIRLAEE